MILGISASGRKNGITSDAVKEVLKATGQEYELISLSGKKINGCVGCVLCAGDNRCKVQDDWNEIGEKMLNADAIVFGAPNYYGNINALGHACLERTFCFRHREVFSLAGKPGVIVSVDSSGNSSTAEFINTIMTSNMMPVVDTVSASGCNQCYVCGYGHDCAVGAVVGDHGFIDKIEDHHLPCQFNEQKDAMFQAYRAGKTLGSIVKNRQSIR